MKANELVYTVMEDVMNEVQRAMSLYQPMRSPEEAMFVIREEYLEAEREIFKKPANRSMADWDAELTQLAAMAIRAKIELAKPAVAEAGA